MTYTDLDLWQENTMLTVHRFRSFQSSVKLTETTDVVFLNCQDTTTASNT